MENAKYKIKTKNQNNLNNNNEAGKNYDYNFKSSVDDIKHWGNHEEGMEERSKICVMRLWGSLFVFSLAFS